MTQPTEQSGSKTPRTDIANCLTCGQIMRPTDYWQRKVSALETSLAESKKECERLREWKERMQKLATPSDQMKFERDHWKQRAESAERELVAARQRNDWFAALFERKWNGVVGSGSRFHYGLRGDWRHIVQKLEGETLDAAINAARAQGGEHEG